MIRTITVVGQFRVARGVTLDDPRIELINPADEQAETFFRSLVPPQ